MVSHHDPDWTKPLTHLADVPIERDRINAMGLPGPTDPFRPYVYGTSRHTLRPEVLDQATVIKAEPVKPKPRKRRKKKAAPPKGVRGRYGYRFDTTQRLHDQPEPAPAGYPKPAPGWKPMTGADIDALLEDL